MGSSATPRLTHSPLPFLPRLTPSNPNTYQLIVTLAEPVRRMYSDYYFLNNNGVAFSTDGIMGWGGVGGERRIRKGGIGYRVYNLKSFNYKCS